MVGVPAAGGTRGGGEATPGGEKSSPSESAAFSMVANRPLFSCRFLAPGGAGIDDGGKPKMLCPPPPRGGAAVTLARLEGRLFGREGILEGVGRGRGLATDPGREGTVLPAAPVKLCLVLGLFNSCSETFLRLLAWSSLSGPASFCNRMLVSFSAKGQHDIMIKMLLLEYQISKRRKTLREMVALQASPVCRQIF